PGGILSIRYSPRSSVIDWNARPVARLVAVTVAPGNTAFDSSETTPLNVAVSPCPNTAPVWRIMSRAIHLAGREGWTSVTPPRAKVALTRGWWVRCRGG